MRTDPERTVPTGRVRHRAKFTAIEDRLRALTRRADRTPRRPGPPLIIMGSVGRHRLDTITAHRHSARMATFRTSIVITSGLRRRGWRIASAQ